ncbi:MAG: type III-B CRISPR module-associated protein Cmr5 [Chloroflexi bacterium]|nr:type III-B CRISPR module-associated protein Cmr5 [Chloroflexota bacterium]GIK29980.1 MAG: hypothetical protein BroJett007_31180 [Chloroflexota bacterium]
MQNLSNQQTLQQQRAASAFQQVEMIDQDRTISDKQKKEYGSLARGLPAMIQIDGLGHALAFLKAKASNNRESHHHRLYGHLAVWLSGRFALGNEPDLLKWLTQQPSATYRQVATEAVAYLLWIRRFVEAKGWKGEE